MDDQGELVADERESEAGEGGAGEEVVEGVSAGEEVTEERKGVADEKRKGEGSSSGGVKEKARAQANERNRVMGP